MPALKIFLIFVLFPQLLMSRLTSCSGLTQAAAIRTMSSMREPPSHHYHLLSFSSFIVRPLFHPVKEGIFNWKGAIQLLPEGGYCVKNKQGLRLVVGDGREDCYYGTRPSVS
jgi:hypothetical protein